MKFELLVALAAACAIEPLELPALKFDVEKADRDIVSIEGIVEVNDEVLLFDSIEAKRLDLIYPYCISAISPSGSEAAYRKYEGLKVRMSGRRLAFKDFKKIESVPRLYLFGERPVSNWCFGDYVILIDEMTPID